MSKSSLQQQLESSSTAEELRAALQCFIDNGTSQDRTAEAISLLLEKRPLFEQNKTDDLLLKAAGEFLLWFMPYTDGTDIDDELVRAHAICARDDSVAKFIYQVLLPNVVSGDSAYAACRSVCRITGVGEDNTLFANEETSNGLVGILDRAPSQDAIWVSAKAVNNIILNSQSAVKLYTDEKHINIFLRSLETVTTARGLEYLLYVLLVVSDEIAKSSPNSPEGEAKKMITLPDLSGRLLKNLAAAETQETIGTAAGAIGNFLGQQREAGCNFVTEEAAALFVRVATLSVTDECTDQLSQCLANIFIVQTTGLEHFVTIEFCSTLVHLIKNCGSANSVKNVTLAICNLIAHVNEIAKLFAKVEGLAEIFLDYAFRHDHSAESLKYVANAICYISIYEEGARVFGTQKVAWALVSGASLFAELETKMAFDDAAENICVTCPQFVSFFATQLCHTTTPYQKELLATTNQQEFCELFSKWEHQGLGIHDADKQYLRYQTLSIICGKIECFFACDDDDDNENECKNLGIIISAVCEIFSTSWYPLADEKLLSVTFLLLLPRCCSKICHNRRNNWGLQDQLDTMTDALVRLILGILQEADRNFRDVRILDEQNDQDRSRMFLDVRVTPGMMKLCLDLLEAEAQSVIMSVKDNQKDGEEDEEEATIILLCRFMQVMIEPYMASRNQEGKDVDSLLTNFFQDEIDFVVRCLETAFVAAAKTKLANPQQIRQFANTIAIFDERVQNRLAAFVPEV